MARDLKGCWLLNEGNGQTAWDSSGYVNSGALQNMEATDWSSGDDGWALTFDGSDEAIYCGTNASLDITGSITIIVRLQTTNMSDLQQMIYCKGLFNADGIYCQLHHDDLAFATNQSGAFQETRSDANLFPINTWVTVAFTRSGTSCRIFIDGIEVSYSETGSHSNPTSSSRTARIGQYDDGSSFEWSGKISYMMIWGRAMTEGEILLLYHNPFVMFDIFPAKFIKIPGVAISNYLENELLDHVFKTGNWTAPTNLFVALYTTAPTDSGGGTEVTGGSYIRVINNSWNVASGGVVDNTSAIDFADATADWGTVLAAGIFDASAGGNLLWWGTCTNITINTGSTITFPAGTIDASIN
jgi:hypothetical protein